MTKKPAIFISKSSAHLAIIKECKKKGVPTATIISKGRTVAVYNRGEIQGYVALAPNTAGIRSPVMEA